MDIDECTEILSDLLEEREREPRVRILWSPRALLLAEDETEDGPFDEQSTQIWEDPRES